MNKAMREKIKYSNTPVKTYWSTLKGFYNGKIVRVIPPLLVNNKLVTDFKAKANIFNHFFSKQ